MFSINQKRYIANEVQRILRETNHPELPAKGEITFNLHITGAESWSWADIQNNGAVANPDINFHNEAQDPSNLLSYMTPPVNPESVSVQAGVLGENELRVKVAELCGWTNYKYHPARVTISDGEYLAFWNMLDPQKKWQTIPPDYPNDLNAMHEAEKILVHPCEANRGKPEYGTYHDELLKICNHSNVQVMFSTARQRAEAFVKTMKGKSVREGG